jgi:hypothetical protein
MTSPALERFMMLCLIVTFEKRCKHAESERSGYESIL